MLIRRLRPEDALEYDKTQAIAFRFPLDIEKRKTEASTDPEPKWARSWAAFADNGDMAACMQIHDFECYFDGHIVGLSGVGGVASRPEYRRGGAIREIFRAWMADSRERGALLSGLYPFSHEFYRQFGYETALEGYEYALRPASLSAYRPFYAGGARMFEAKSPTPELQSMIDAFGAKYNLAVRRREHAWNRLLEGDNYQKMRFPYAIFDDAGLCAWCVTRNQRIDDEDCVVVSDVAWRDPAGYRQLMGFLSRMASDTTLRLSMPPDAQILLLSPEPYDVRKKPRETPMVRVLDIGRALSLTRHPENANYTIAVRDAFLPENDGVYAVRVKDGETIVRRTGASPDIEMDAAVFSQMIVGGVSLDETVLRPDVKLNGNEETLFRVFVKKPVWHPDHY